MGKFNKKAKTISQQISSDPTATKNLAGGLAFNPSAELDLYLRACTGLFEDQYYRKASTQLSQLKALIPQCRREFVLKLAAYVRNEMNLRSMPIALLAEAAKMPNPTQDSLVRLFTPLILRRADEPQELLAYLFGDSDRKTNSAKIPMSLKRGICDTLERFDEYQFQKWDKNNAAISLKDVFRLVHPKPKNEKRAELYKKVVSETLAVAETWETYISTKGSTAENWNYISEKMPIMALLRNLRNFEEKNASVATQNALKKFQDPQAVLNSKQLPFRWLSAFNQVNSTETKDALIGALEISVDGIKKFEGTSAIFVDLSGSMSSPLSDKSSLSYRDVGCLMGALACRVSVGNYLVGAFGDSYKTVTSVSRKDSVMTNFSRILKTNVGHSTDAYLCLEHLLTTKKVVDRVFIFSDMQCYDSSPYRGERSLAGFWRKYVREINPKAKLYSFDLSGYGTLQFPEKDSSIVSVAGWSDRVFEFVHAYEKLGSAVSVIEKIPTPQGQNFFEWQTAMRESLKS